MGSITNRRGRDSERGALVVIAAIVLVAIGGFLALSLNVGHLVRAKGQLQSAFDSAALAGAAQLDGTYAGVIDAKNTAVGFGVRHALDAEVVGLGVADVTPGYWDLSARRFYAFGQPVTIGGSSVTLSATTPTFINAVRVRANTDGLGAHNQTRDVWLNGFLGGQDHVKVGATAVAVGGGPCTDGGCTLPMVVPSCALVDGGGDMACGSTVTLHFNHGHGKDVALADITQPSKSVNNAEVRNQMQAGAACTNPTVRVGDSVRLGNGNDFNSQVEQKLYSPNNVVCKTGKAPYTNCPHRQLAVANIGTNCSVPMNQSAAVVGFVRVVILDTNSGGKDESITVYLDCSDNNAASAGCASFGYGSRKWRLVQ